MEIPSKPWQGSVDEILPKLETTQVGLTTLEAQKRFFKYGANTIRRQTPIPYLQIFFDQFADLLVIMLIVASLLSFFLGDNRNGIIIMCIVFLNAVIGFTQEFKTEKILRALIKLLPQKIKVKRDGREEQIKTDYLVPGDIVILEEGDKVPADIRLMESYDLRLDEQVLTGEAIAQNKRLIDYSVENLTVLQQENMVFMGTTVVRGEALGVVVLTGHQTVFGKIAQRTMAIDKTLSPLQEKTGQMAKRVAVLAAFITILLVVYKYFIGHDLTDALIFSVAVAAALVPEGLPATVSIALSLGAKHLAHRKALVRNLVSVETLGSVTTICTDKTGTLTTGEMTVKHLWKYTESGLSSAEIEKKIFEVMALCNDAQENEKGFIGDQIEVALLKYLKEMDKETSDIRKNFQKKGEIPFNAERRFMAVSMEDENGIHDYLKGAPEILMEKCELTEEKKQLVLEKMKEFTLNGDRVLAFSYDKNFLGFAAIADPPRSEVAEAVRRCEDGKVRVIMVTGDNPVTAKAIAKMTGIVFSDKEEVMLGDQVAKMGDIELRENLRKVRIFARILPEQKYRIVDNLSKMGEIVAVTGDGVNDAPALKRADIGIAMGKAGTDVSRESADMILLDDNFATIVQAIKEGRIIFDNVKKFLFFIFAHNFEELGIVLLGIVLGLPLPMLAVQILAVDLGTDVLPSMSIIAEKEEDVMNSKPRSKEVQLLSGESFIHLFLIGLIVGIGSIINFRHVLASTGNYAAATTIAFTTLAIAQAFYIFLARTPDKSVLKYPFWQNKYLFGAVAISLSILFAIIYWPVFNSWFFTAPFGAGNWSNVLIVGVVLIIFEEIYKFVRNRLHYKYE